MPQTENFRVIKWDIKILIILSQLKISIVGKTAGKANSAQMDSQPTTIYPQYCAAPNAMELAKLSMIEVIKKGGNPFELHTLQTLHKSAVYGRLKTNKAQNLCHLMASQTRKTAVTMGRVLALQL